MALLLLPTGIEWRGKLGHYPLEFWLCLLRACLSDRPGAKLRENPIVGVDVWRRARHGWSFCRPPAAKFDVALNRASPGVDCKNMSWVDLVVLGVMIVSALVAFMRGFVREVLTVVAWVGAAVVAIKFITSASTLLSPHLPSPDWAEPVGYSLLFIISLIVFSLIAKSIASAVRSSAVGGIDRTLGLIFGLARGAALLIAAYILIGTITPLDQWQAVLDARSLQPICKGAAWVGQRAPAVVPGLEFKVQPCPPPPSPVQKASVDDILKAAPSGRAIDPPIRR